MTPQRWKLPIIGYELRELWLSGETYLIFYGLHPDTGRAQFSIGGIATLHHPAADPLSLNGTGPWMAWTALFDLRHHKLAEATVTIDGDLDLTFDQATRLSVHPDDNHENWGLSGPGDLILACPPGGGDPRIAGNLPTL